MKKILCIFLCLISTATFSHHFFLGKEKSATLDRISWSLKGNGHSHIIQNVSGKPLRLDLWVDKIVAGTLDTPSDGIYVLCGQGFQKMEAGTGIICDIPYPGYVMFAVYPFVNGATGHFGIHY
ncbi:hypothetical protein [Legionella sp. W05-934-2]|uniref:hypothetical protein n=1 Tax=Legionella sp. W05-934-2 TaxID=1198649 RepID=UPI003462801B